MIRKASDPTVNGASRYILQLLCVHSICRLGISVTMSMVFGYDVAVGDIDDQYVALAEQVITDATRVLQPGATLVNVIPMLRFIPPWVPGASTQRLAAKAKEAWIAYKTKPFANVKSNLVSASLHMLANSLKLRAACGDSKRLHVDGVAEAPSAG